MYRQKDKIWIHKDCPAYQNKMAGIRIREEIINGEKHYIKICNACNQALTFKNIEIKEE